MYGTLVALIKSYNFPEYCMAVNQMPFELELETQLFAFNFRPLFCDRQRPSKNHNRTIVLRVLARRAFGLQPYNILESCRFLSMLQVFHTWFMQILPLEGSTAMICNPAI